MSQTNLTVNSTTDQEEQKRKRNKKILTIVLSIILVVLVVLICVEIAYIADFYIYRDSGKDGLLWTASQRLHGLFGTYNN
ncbi:hypothetical protein [Mycoplasma hafezii]|uniref:hypothetical protein n=1 Tax=Mycoplasma hafezii TaxID=525886 RepID=UPI003CEC73AD